MAKYSYLGLRSEAYQTYDNICSPALMLSFWLRRHNNAIFGGLLSLPSFREQYLDIDP